MDRTELRWKLVELFSRDGNPLDSDIVWLDFPYETQKIFRIALFPQNQSEWKLDQQHYKDQLESIPDLYVIKRNVTLNPTTKMRVLIFECVFE